MIHECTRHEPGSAACYTRHACRCDLCRIGAGRAKKRYAAMPSPLIPVEPVRAHIQSLCAKGRTVAWVAGRIGRSKSYVEYLLTDARRTHPQMASIILALDTDTVGGMVDAIGTQRRIQALAVNGWPTSRIDAELRQAKGYTHHILSTPRVLDTTARRYAEMYNRLWDVPPRVDGRDARGAVTRTKRWAARNRWAGPMAWDDDLGPHGIDNPAATPCLPADTHGGRISEAVWLIDAGESPSRIAARVGYKDRDGLYQALNRAGLGDQVRRLSKAQQAEYDALRDTGLGEIRGPRKVA